MHNRIDVQGNPVNAVDPWGLFEEAWGSSWYSPGGGHEGLTIIDFDIGWVNPVFPWVHNGWCDAYPRRQWNNRFKGCLDRLRSDVEKCKEYNCDGTGNDTCTEIAKIRFRYCVQDNNKWTRYPFSGCY